MLWPTSRNRHPKKLVLEDGDELNSCANLSKEGICKVYETDRMPGKCKENYCSFINEKPLDEILFGINNDRYI